MMPIAPKLLPTKNLTTTKNKIKKNDPPGLFFLGLLFLGSFFIPGVLSVIDALFILTKNSTKIISAYPLDRKTLKLNLSLILTQNPTSPHNR